MNVICFNAEKLYRLSYDYFHYEGNIKLAEACINKALKYDKKQVKGLLLKGNILMSKDDIKGAIAILKKALKEDAKNKECLYLMAKAYSLNGMHQAAIDILDKIFIFQISDMEFLSDCYELKINILMELQKYKKAEQILKSLNNKLLSQDIFYLKENFYKIIQNNAYFARKNNNRILHVNF